MLVMPLESGGLSTFSALSDEESLEETFSSFSGLRDDFDGRFSESFGLFSSLTGDDVRDLRSFEDFLSSFLGVTAAHAPQDDPSRTTLGRSFFDDLDSFSLES